MLQKLTSFAVLLSFLVGCDTGGSVNSEPPSSRIKLSWTTDLSGLPVNQHRIYIREQRDVATRAIDTSNSRSEFEIDTPGPGEYHICVAAMSNDDIPGPCSSTQLVRVP